MLFICYGFMTLLVSLSSRIVIAQQWDISDPSIQNRGLRLILDYTISNTLKEDDVSVEMFRDDGFKDSIGTENDYLRPEIVVDGSTGTQKVTITFNVDPVNILDSPIISSAETRSIVAFGARLSIRDPKIPSSTVASLDTPVIFELTTATKVGITDILEEQEESYGVKVFECDSSNNRLPVVLPKTQQDTLRICVQANDETQYDAVEIDRIVDFSLESDGNVQSIISNGSIQNPKITEQRCIPGQNLCYISTFIDNSFFAKQQTVTARGISTLLYVQDNGRRLLEESQIRQRRTRTAGGSAGQKPFDLSFAVEPSGATYEARAYFCDQNKKEMAEDEIQQVAYGERISICVAPSQRARDEGVFIRDIKSFVFRKNGKEQHLEQRSETVQKESADVGADPPSGQEQSSSTYDDCAPGDTVCNVQLSLAAYFFDGDGEPVVGEGEVELQYGSGKMTWTRRKTLSLSLSHRADRRSLQDNDPDSAGLASVAISIPIDPSSTPPPVAWASQSLNFWTSMPLYARVLIIVGVLFLIIFFLLGAWCFVYGFDSFYDLLFWRDDDSNFFCEDYYGDEYFDGDYTDPEECAGDSEEDLKGGGLVHEPPLTRSRTTAITSMHKKVDSPTSASNSTRSTSSHSQSAYDPAKSCEGRTKGLAKAKIHTLPPKRTQSNDSIRPHSSCTNSLPKTRSQANNATEASMSSTKRIPPTRSRSNDIVKAANSASSRAPIGSQSKLKRMARSLSPSRNRNPGTPPHLRPAPTRGGNPALEKKPKSFESGMSHGSNSERLGRSRMRPLPPQQIPPGSSAPIDLKKAPPQSGTVSKRPSETGPKKFVTTTSKKSTAKRSKSNDSRHSAHSVGSCSTSKKVTSGDQKTKAKKKRKNDGLTNSSHSVQSFASSNASMCSRGSEMSKENAGVGTKRGKRPTKGKKKGTKITNSYDIISALD